jgi:hypothetical protein
MPEEKTPEPTQAEGALQQASETEVVVDRSKAAPIYVSAVSVGRKAGSPFVFLSFYSGTSLPVGSFGTNSVKSVNTLIASFVLEVEQAKFLYQNLKDFLQSVGEEV